VTATTSDAYLELERRLGRPLAEFETVLEELNAMLTAVVGADSLIRGVEDALADE
jgi:hypothetical protein